MPNNTLQLFKSGSQEDIVSPSSVVEIQTNSQYPTKYIK